MRAGLSWSAAPSLAHLAGGSAYSKGASLATPLAPQLDPLGTLWALPPPLAPRGVGDGRLGGAPGQRGGSRGAPPGPPLPPRIRPARPRAPSLRPGPARTHLRWPRRRPRRSG